MIIAVMTPGLAARSQTAYTPAMMTAMPVIPADTALSAVHEIPAASAPTATPETSATPVVADTLHVTPAMLDSMRRNKPTESFERKLESVVFVPKGQWIAGLSLSYTQSNQNAYQFLVLENLNGDTYSFKVSPKVLYAIRNDMALGFRFSYQRALTKLESASINLGTDAEYDVDYLYSLGHNYFGTILYRNYFSLGRSRRFGFFNEVQLELGGGQSKLSKGRGADLSGTYEQNFQANIGIVPGLVVFLSNYSAIEVNIGVLGFSYMHTKSISDQIYVSHRKSQSANFRINLFSITFGAVFYL